MNLTYYYDIIGHQMKANQLDDNLRHQQQKKEERKKKKKKKKKRDRKNDYRP